MNIAASNPIISSTKDINPCPAAAVQPPSGHGATASANEQAPVPVQQQPNDIKG
ncbi:hypothetical protein [Undibacterium sp. TS12]|uniref:hypothetical protein n=1 Tax=Undibacterium sp. TS12 TaxID=2908202 RepID=UPI001F4CF803|nr:hypothetical protein [Undibacterium sp. TS12]MCH8621945.1 hypothetical protein [Undibacterium sp. TS12]